MAKNGTKSQKFKKRAKSETIKFCGGMNITLIQLKRNNL